ncbi:MAG: radical SAM protein [Deltaproteobacteria bacterium]|nr:radical SAM protein [Deltaproteobacteria bacterium]
MPKVFLKGMNACHMRNREVLQYRKFFIANGYEFVAGPESADVILVWTCGFREDYKTASIQKCLNYKENYSGSLVIAGCLPSIAPDEIRAYFPDVEMMPWKNDVCKMNELFSANGCTLSEFDDLIYVEEQVCEDAAEYRRKHPDADVTFHDQFIKMLVAEGCKYNCTYCSEKAVFPAYRSFPVFALADELALSIQRTGVNKAILLADSLGQYGNDIGSSFGELLLELKRKCPAAKFALNNLHLSDFLRFKDILEELIKENTICHINLPIQSGSDRILLRMNRLYEKQDIVEVFSLFNKIGFKDFDTHIIVGFPGESERDFNETLEILTTYRPKYVLGSLYMESQAAASRQMFPKISTSRMVARARTLQQAMDSAGIICNCDHSEISNERLNRMCID